MTPSTFRRVVIHALVAAVILPPASLGALAGGEAPFQGRVVDADGLTPMAGVVVTLVDPGSAASFASGPSADNGSFQIAGAPTGSYTLIAETSRGAFLAPRPVVLGEGHSAPVSLSLRANADEEGGGSEVPAMTPRRVKGGPTGWGKWLIVGGIVVGGFAVLDAVTKDETAASPF